MAQISILFSKQHNRWRQNSFVVLRPAPVCFTWIRDEHVITHAPAYRVAVLSYRWCEYQEHHNQVNQVLACRVSSVSSYRGPSRGKEKRRTAMLNQAVVEALYSATYIENYLDCVENLPNDLQRYVSRLRELDATCQTYLYEVDQQQEVLRSDSDPIIKRRSLMRIQQALIAAQEIGDEKLQIVQQVQDLIENKSRQLEVDYRNLDFGKEQENSESVRESNMNSTSNNASHANNAERQPKRARRTRTETLIESTHSMDMMVGITETRSSTLSTASNGNQKKTAAAATGKKKKRKSRQGNQQNQHREDTPPPPEDDLAIDPDEPTYCLCDQISYGEMILCDNDLCPIEWFHFSCVSLTTKPKGKWFCPKCRGDRPNVMKPKAQFLKELERYNKEKEEKS